MERDAFYNNCYSWYLEGHVDYRGDGISAPRATIWPKRPRVNDDAFDLFCTERGLRQDEKHALRHLMLDVKLIPSMYIGEHPHACINCDNDIKGFKVLLERDIAWKFDDCNVFRGHITMGSFGATIFPEKSFENFEKIANYDDLATNKYTLQEEICTHVRHWYKGNHVVPVHLKTSMIDEHFWIHYDGTKIVINFTNTTGGYDVTATSAGYVMSGCPKEGFQVDNKRKDFMLEAWVRPDRFIFDADLTDVMGIQAMINDVVYNIPFHPSILLKYRGIKTHVVPADPLLAALPPIDQFIYYDKRNSALTVTTDVMESEDGLDDNVSVDVFKIFDKWKIAKKGSVKAVLTRAGLSTDRIVRHHDQFLDAWRLYHVIKRAIRDGVVCMKILRGHCASMGIFIDSLYLRAYMFEIGIYCAGSEYRVKGGLTYRELDLEEISSLYKYVYSYISSDCVYDFVPG